MMLQSSKKKCCHSKVLPTDCCTFCELTVPESLLEICFQYVADHLETLCDRGIFTFDNMRLRKHIALPVEICERLLNVKASRPGKRDMQFLHIFDNMTATRLKRVKLRNAKVDDVCLKILLKHRLVDLEVTNCPDITMESIKHLTAFGRNLVSLTIGENINMFPYATFGVQTRLELFCGDKERIFLADNLKRLTLRCGEGLLPDFYALLLKPLGKLTHLDLSNSSQLGNLKCIEHLTHLNSLILYNVFKLESAVASICKMANLRHLDISQCKEDAGKFEGGSVVLARLVESLPRLTSLDISGTNLAGTGVAELNDDFRYASDIPGLGLRVNNPLHFLGLYETQHDACLRHDIPSKLIAGNANEEQILVAAMAYMDRPEMLQKVLNELFHLFRFESCQHIGQALHIVLESMNRHLNERHIQISGSATLFYIVKGTGVELHEVFQVKRRIITTLLNGMCAHKNDDTMMRNGCLTLCQFKIPADVVFDYERLVEILLHSVYGMQQESFVQRIGIYLLNSLACQVDRQQKVKLGDLGAITKMLWLIMDRLAKGLCDDVLEVAWSTMWNVTDETPANCKKFLENRGMEYFLECLQKFPDKEELLRNMMGLLGNVAEVRELRYYLMKREYICVFSNLLDSLSDGIEVSYNAAGVISHIASDGPEVWTIKEPSREYVLSRMMSAIDRWDLSSHRNINYRSFEPILYLVKIFDTPECQRWAAWALANLTRVYPDKYCNLVIAEGGIAILQEVLVHPVPPFNVKELASIVVANCNYYKDNGFLCLDG